MKKLMFFCLVILCINSVAMAADVYIDDNTPHAFNDDTYQGSSVWLDYNTANYPGTLVNLVNGGVLTDLWAYNSSTVTMSGGLVGRYLGAWNDSTVTMSGGSVGYLNVHENATVTVNGGTIGSVLEAYDDGTIYLDGIGFEVTDEDDNTTSLSYGNKLSDFVSLIENGEHDYYFGFITGTLSADGSALNSLFQIFNTGEYAGTGDIIIIPEPATLVLLGLGGLLLRKRRA